MSRSSHSVIPEPPGGGLDDLPARTRNCTDKGNQFFLDQCTRNKEKARQKIFSVIEQIELDLSCFNIESARVLLESLHTAYDEYKRAHLRILELRDEQVEEPPEEKNCHEEVHQAVQNISTQVANFEPPPNVAHHLRASDPPNNPYEETKVENTVETERMNKRLSLHEKIKEQITVSEGYILENDLQSADKAVLELDKLLSEFISFAPACQPGQKPPSGIDFVKEGEFTDLVDSSVFNVKKALSEAKAKLEVPPRSSISDVISRSQKNHKSSSLPPKAPQSEHSGRSSRSRKRHPHEHSRRDGSKNGSEYSHRTRSGSNRSGRSTGSTTSSLAREKAMEEKARLEALKIEAKFLAESQQRDMERSKLEMAEAQAKVNKEMAIAEAKAKVYEDHAEVLSLCSNSSGRSSNPSRKERSRDKVAAASPVESKKLTTKGTEQAPEPISKNQLTTHHESSSLSHLNDLCNLLKISSAPDVDMDYFSGNPLDYHYFMSLFEELVEKKVDDPFGKLARLIKYTRGEAKELIQHCSQMSQPDGFLLAKKLLEKEYGDPHRITSAYMKELNSWKPIKSGDVKAFKRFYRFLLKCDTNRRGEVYLRFLDNPETLRILQLKLPQKLHDRWARKAVHHRETNKKELDFTHFLEFVRLETNILDDPVYSSQPDHDDRVNDKDRKEFQDKQRRDNSQQRQAAFATKVSEPHEACLYCADRHDIDTCEKFLQLDHREKKAYLFRQKFCFYCYGVFSRDEHGYNKCKERRICKTCEGNHPTALHQEEKVDSIEKSRATQTNDAESGTSMPILPVRVYHSDSPDSYEVVYALLDICSTGVFILQDCADKLKVQTSSRTVRLKTVIGMKRLSMKLVKKGLMVVGLHDGARPIPLPKTYCKEDLLIDHNEIVSIDSLKEYHYLEGVAKEFHRYGNDIPIALIIGSNCQKAVEQIESIPSEENGPFAFRTRLGWCVAGPIELEDTDVIKCNRIKIKDISTNTIAKHHYVLKSRVEDVSISEKLQEMYAIDFNEKSSEKKALSVEDAKFINLMETEGEFIDNHHHLPLPLRKSNPMLPNNRSSVVKRANSVKRKMLRNSQYHSDYTNFMSSLLTKGYARKVDQASDVVDGLIWYVPHHGVYHPKTKKFRVVMDCGAEYEGRSLNSELIPGPDNTNLLLGVLLRFRQNRVPIMGDLEQMFFQINVPEKQRSLLRFLWWPDGDITKDPEEYEMCVHLFGAVSSPSVAGYALRKTATDNAHVYGDAAANAILRNFYVDDFLKSESTVEKALKMILDVDNICASGGWNLTKIVSSRKEILESIPVAKRAKEFQSLDISGMGLPIERALGIIWNVVNDTLGFRIQFSEKELCRRVILSDVSSVYDPDGRGCAFVLPGKKVLQELTGQKEDWDSVVSAKHAERWRAWQSDMVLLAEITTPRCYIPEDFGEPVSQTLHCFSDASTIGYGQATYLRSINAAGECHISLVTAKSRVAPLRDKTMPRLELTAATTSVKVGATTKEELDYEDLEIIYWVDSTIVLGYISNETARYPVFVRNRLNTIHNYSDKESWRYVPSEENPADLASRGLSPRCAEKVDMWFNGPAFLWKGEEEWPLNIAASLKGCEIEEVIAVNEVLLEDEFDLLSALEPKFSSWYKLVRTVAYLKRMAQAVKLSVQAKVGNNPISTGSISNYLRSALAVSDIQSAELQVFRLTQQKYMAPELKILSEVEPVVGVKDRKQEKKKKEVQKRSSLSNLDPFVDADGVIRVGGRLENSQLESKVKHPVVIPKDSAASPLLIRKAHLEVAHCGRCSTLNKLREDGFWIVGANSAVKSHVHKCRTCRELRGKLGSQKMADLPSERVVPSPPFTHCGADAFGPVIVKEGRKEVKRYGIIFTCMALRAVHIEVTSKLDTDTFIQALRRFISRRGQVSSIRTDNGTNFTGAERELKAALEEMDNTKISEFLLAKGCDWIVWKRNPPEASHMGGVWERQIRSIRTILTALMKNHASMLNDESLRTFMTEVEAIINSRPLTVDTLNDPQSPTPLSPIQLLTFKSDVVFPPPGKFERADVYSRKHWRRVQYLANEFWSRWKSEYLSSLQSRQKWTKESRNFMVGDVVLVKDSNIFTKRNGWPMALVEEVLPSDDGLVRQVRLRVAYKQENKTRTLLRPITKLVLLVGADEHNH